MNAFKTSPEVTAKETRISRLRSAISLNWDNDALCEEFRAEISKLKQECASEWDARVNFHSSKRLESMGY